jgi:hypothetical protein
MESKCEDYSQKKRAQAARVPLVYLAMHVLDFKDKEKAGRLSSTEAATVTTGYTTNTLGLHYPDVNKDTNARCIVCRLDFNTQSDLRERYCSNNKNRVLATASNAVAQSNMNMKDNLAVCSKCRITAHSMMPPWKQHIHGINCFKGLTCCFQIAHTPEGFEIWRCCNPSDKSGKIYYLQLKHHICNLLRELHGIQPSQAHKRKRTDNNNFDDDTTGNSSTTNI